MREHRGRDTLELNARTYAEAEQTQISTHQSRLSTLAEALTRVPPVLRDAGEHLTRLQTSLRTAGSVDAEAAAAPRRLTQVRQCWDSLSIADRETLLASTPMVMAVPSWQWATPTPPPTWPPWCPAPSPDSPVPRPPR
ncbi:hypothetical protein [Crossiella cryophila]|uniref:Uncharacterized protein n=1 Tax=Crossiella cryophila TaxID=43355 RepID=A0A7W7CKR6_9PSEU|nr:hypothetical protein [Crossiella cryophila]MBB4681274.1 hypothetical protein [Crossiella cryophila]